MKQWEEKRKGGRWQQRMRERERLAHTQNNSLEVHVEVVPHQVLVFLTASSKVGQELNANS